MKKSFNEFKEYIKNKKIAVLGMGVSNRPLIDLLIRLGANLTAFDRKTHEQLGNVVYELRDKGVSLVLGEDYLEKLEGYDVIFKTPSVRNDIPALLRAKEKGAYITSEMEEFIRYCPAKIYGITGSDGKTTTTTLVYNMLKEEGYNTWVGGNIGTPLFSKIEEISKDDKVVLELSSFQLMTIDCPVDISLITNISPNHLDVHKDMDEYIDAKKNIFRYGKEDNILVLNKDNEITNKMKEEVLGKIVQFSLKEEVSNGAYYSNGNLYIMSNKVCNIEEIKLKGMHNVENLLAAFCCVCGEVSIDSMRKVAVSFAGVPHRMEFVKRVKGVDFYNDSIASSPTRTLAALKAFNKSVILIAGGYDKNISFDTLAKEGHEFVKALVLLGRTRDKIKDAFETEMKNNNINIPIYMVDSLEEAVDVSLGISVGGDIVTLSPACASFDMFTNFEERGNKFKEIVNNIL
ncbi:UDP-N-acetylmuramoyl-L-alanine--D-glutamate ligase [Clostridium sp. MSJ-11]|uniref:UDP-N-acetylmuramoylalanine--D-glutamate ligase n=1 Tax=Clostridium mobile TaxID=2841512 RepID=A0ABS6EM98_9CLOT|nr:UDP-N-acetylmuramoyl-L-alanine--D-glutamate ligase [Clostridium mobile]MBU5486252.1 UDP-N-acetylmuramoyl-L-alanine--D-glutamate ligase [Clostridium mobile]